MDFIAKAFSENQICIDWSTFCESNPTDSKFTVSGKKMLQKQIVWNIYVLDAIKSCLSFTPALANTH